MTPDLRICRTHDAADFGEYGNGNGPCCRAGFYPRATACAPAAFVWSADGHALLEIEECDGCAPPQGDGKGTACLGYHPPTVDENGDESGEGVYEWGSCPKCGGSGWKSLHSSV